MSRTRREAQCVLTAVHRLIAVCAKRCLIALAEDSGPAFFAHAAGNAAFRRSVSTAPRKLLLCAHAHLFSVSVSTKARTTKSGQTRPRSVIRKLCGSSATKVPKSLSRFAKVVSASQSARARDSESLARLLTVRGRGRGLLRGPQEKRVVPARKSWGLQMLFQRTRIERKRAPHRDAAEQELHGSRHLAARREDESTSVKDTSSLRTPTRAQQTQA